MERWLSLHLSPNDVDIHLLSIRHRLGRPMASFKSPIQSLLPVWPWTYQWASLWGEWQHPERLTARFIVMTQEKCLAFICSFTAPTFTLLIEEMLLWTLPGGAAGILFSIQFTEKLLHIFSFFTCFLSFLNHPTQPSIIFFFFFFTIYLFDCWILVVACKIFIASWGIFRCGAQILQ